MPHEAVTVAARCPHCGNVAELEPASSLGHRCRICGGPRVPRDGHDVPISRSERAALTQARARTFQRAAWVVGAISVGALGLLALLAAVGVLVIAQPGWIATLATLLVATVPLALATYAWTRATELRRSIVGDLDAARLEVARAIAAAAPDGLDATDLAAALRGDEAQAELLLAHLSAEDFVRARIDDEGGVRFAALSSAPRVRVEPTDPLGPEPPVDTTTDDPTARPDDAASESGDTAPATTTVPRGA